MNLLFQSLVGLSICTSQCNEVREILAYYKPNYNASKLWHTYIKYFLKKQLKTHSVINSYFSSFAKCSLVLKQKSMQNYGIPKEYHGHIVEDLQRGKSRGRIFVDQSEPTGWVNQSSAVSHHWLLNKIEWKMTLIAYKIAAEMFLNLLSIPTNAVLKCNYAALFVSNCKDQDRGRAWVFCGLISASYLYPPHQKICLVSMLPPRISFSFEIRYAVCDTMIKSQNLKFKASKHDYFKITGTFNFDNIGQLFIFFLRAGTINNFMINIRHFEEAQVYDGPGLLSPKLEPTAAGTVISTTFQCTLVVFTQHSLPRLRFHFWEIVIHKNITIVPGMCNIFVRTPQNHYLNVTIKKHDF